MVKSYQYMALPFSSSISYMYFRKFHILNTTGKAQDKIRNSVRIAMLTKLKKDTANIK